MPATEPSLSDLLAEVRQVRRMSAALLCGRDAAAFLGMDRTSFYRRVAAGVIPKAVRVGNGPRRWRRAELEKFVGALKPARNKVAEIGP
jgi:predicted DNA-binding transcriptional regulator AlpA